MSPATVQTGNTILPPPRLTGDSTADIAALFRYIHYLHEQLAVSRNVVGTLDDHESRIYALEHP